MFEKEAEEYADRTRIKDENTYISFPDERIIEVQDYEGNIIDIRERIEKTFKDGAKFAYSKANEWHYHEIPTDYTKPYLCKVIHPTKNDMTDYEILFYDEKEISWFRWLMPWDGGESNTLVRINRKVIAWCEIPQYTEE